MPADPPKRTAFLIAFGLILLCFECAAKEKAKPQMMRVESPNFEIIAPCNREECIQILRLFEWARLMFEKNFQLERPPRKTLVFVFPSEADWQKIGPIARSNGFYSDLPSRGHIVLRSLKDWQMTGLHEFAHLWMRQKMKQHAAWLDEGIACFFEGIIAEKGRIQVGFPVAHRLQWLVRERWLPADRVFSIQHSRDIQSSNEVALFYAQSWALVHMLRLSPEFKLKFPEFFEAVASGRPPEEALRSIYGVTPSQLMQSAKHWISRPAWPAESLEWPERTQIRILISPAPPETVELLRATFTAVHQPDDERRRVFAAFAEKLGSACPNHLALGDLAFNLGLMDRAARHYSQAVDCGASADEIGRGITLAAAGSGAFSQRLLEEVEAAAQDRSLRADAAAALLAREEPESALKATEDLSNMQRDAQFRATRIRAMALIRLKRFEEAEGLARELEAMAAEDSERRSVELLLHDIGQHRRAAAAAATPAHEIYLRQLQRADGIVTRVDCMDAWARLWVTAADGREIRLRIADPADVVTGDGAGEQIDLQCGPQQRRAVIGYQPEENAEAGTQGRVKYFRPLQ